MWTPFHPSLCQLHGRIISSMDLRNQTVVLEFLLWASRRTQNSSHSSLGCSSPCTWSWCVGICSSFWLLPSTSTSTPPWASSSHTCLFLIFVSTPPWFPSADEHPDSEQSHHLTYADCITQIYFFSVFVCLDNLLLVMMAYDKFMAICHPCTKQS